MSENVRKCQTNVRQMSDKCQKMSDNVRKCQTMSDNVRQMSENVRQMSDTCQTNVRKCQKMSDNVRNCQTNVRQMSENVRRCQKMSDKCQKISENVRQMLVSAAIIAATVAQSLRNRQLQTYKPARSCSRVPAPSAHTMSSVGSAVSWVGIGQAPMVHPTDSRTSLCSNAPL